MTHPIGHDAANVFSFIDTPRTNILDTGFDHRCSARPTWNFEARCFPQSLQRGILASGLQEKNQKILKNFWLMLPPCPITVPRSEESVSTRPADVDHEARSTLRRPTTSTRTTRSSFDRPTVALRRFACLPNGKENARSPDSFLRSHTFARSKNSGFTRILRGFSRSDRSVSLLADHMVEIGVEGPNRCHNVACAGASPRRPCLAAIGGGFIHEEPRSTAAQMAP